METIGPIFFLGIKQKTQKNDFSKKIFFRFLDPKNLLVRKNFDPKKKLKIKIFDLRKKFVLSFKNSALGSGGPEHIA